MKIKSIKDYKGSLKGKKVLLRTDLNVPIAEGRVGDDYKLERQMPTLNYLLQKGAKVIIMSHLGRPDPAKREAKYSLRPVGEWLQKELGKNKVLIAKDSIGYDSATKTANLHAGQALLLENLRYEAGEKSNSKVLARQYAKLADVYVNNAFAVSHRTEASVVAVKSFLPAYAGFLLENELRHLERIIRPKQPFVAVLGGAKLKTKMPLIKQLLPKADHVLLGGGLANTLLKARGFEVGKSLCDPDSLDLAAKLRDKKIILPVDAVVSRKNDGWQPRAVKIADVQKDEYIFDIGPQSIKLYSRFIKEAATIVWNGPLGMFEDKRFKHGTMAIAQLIAARSTGRAFGAAGGGETVEALRATKMMDRMDWVSTGGGAMLSYLSGQKLPGLSGLVK